MTLATYIAVEPSGKIVMWYKADDSTVLIPPVGSTITLSPIPAPLRGAPFEGAVLALIDGVVVWADFRGLDAVKAAKVQELTLAWEVAVKAGVTANGVTYSTSTTGLQVCILTQLITTDGSAWVDYPVQLTNGTWDILTQAKAQALWAALRTQTKSLLTQLRDKMALVAAAATTEAVNAITW